MNMFFTLLDLISIDLSATVSSKASLPVGQISFSWWKY